MKQSIFDLNYSDTNLHFDMNDFPNLTGLNCTLTNLETLDITPLSKLKNLLCSQGTYYEGQHYGLILTLILTEEQKVMWDSTWSTNHMNSGVIPFVKASVDGGIGNDFNSGGNF